MSQIACRNTCKRDPRSNHQVVGTLSVGEGILASHQA